MGNESEGHKMYDDKKKIGGKETKYCTKHISSFIKIHINYRYYINYINIMRDNLNPNNFRAITLDYWKSQASHHCIKTIQNNLEWLK